MNKEDREKAPNGFTFELVNSTNKMYSKLQQAICTKYQERYGAMVHPAPDLFAYLNAPFKPNDMAGACFGITRATRPLFSEQYLELPLENIVKNIIGRVILRYAIVEVGSVVSTGVAGSASKLLEMMPWIIWSIGAEIVLITATEQLREILNKIDITFHPIARASAEKLQTNPTIWGNYYESYPVTGIIDIKAALFWQMSSHFSEKFSVDPFEINFNNQHNFLFNGECDETRIR